MRGRRRVYPLVVGYLLVVGLSIGVLVERRPPFGSPDSSLALVEDALPAFSPFGAKGTPTWIPPQDRSSVGSGGRTDQPWWLLVFRPTPATARLLLQRAIPLFGAGDDTLILYDTIGAPQSILEALFPFTRSGAPAETKFRAAILSATPLPTGPSPVAPPQGTGLPLDAPPPPGFDLPSDADNGLIESGTQTAPAGQAPACGPGGRAAAVRAVNDGAALVGIYHTHDYESYVSEFPDQKPPEGRWDRVATLDPERNIIRVGARLAEALCERGVTVVHSPSRNAYTYLGAYTKSLETARHILEQYPTIKVLLDLHRDDAPRSTTTAMIGGLPVARSALVVGRGSDDLPQPSWRRNEGFARSLHDAMEERFPGLSRGIIIKDTRYNQHLLPAALVLEVGSAQNTMAEALRAVDLLAGVLADLLREGRYPR